MEFIDRLIGWMKENKIKQAEISDKANMSRGYISKVVNGSKPPSENLINVLAKMSGKSVHWWLFGEDEYKGLASLNALIDTFIKCGDIRQDGKYDKDTEKMLHIMLDKEIRDKLKEAQH
ncbi:helix-turn-helix transcriptional regulator [Clostridium sp. VAP41]|uniref:helix-turn-helix domain-containing protein n=1 Tax=Clostridium sp. VAP41 TaxID=2949979 RepID=UPI0002F841A3|nr:helix-turn-helix transcriptional regulator [Clostridium sp. VAP41]